MIYQQIIAVLKTLDYGNAIHYASQHAFELQQLHDEGICVNDLVLQCMEHK